MTTGRCVRPKGSMWKLKWPSNALRKLRLRIFRGCGLNWRPPMNSRRRIWMWRTLKSFRSSIGNGMSRWPGRLRNINNGWRRLTRDIRMRSRNWRPSYIVRLKILNLKCQVSI